MGALWKPVLIGLGLTALVGILIAALLNGGGWWSPPPGASAPRRPYAPGSVLELAAYKMVQIEAGEYQMGSPDTEAERYADEALHPVRISRPFLIGTTEVTAGLWRGASMNLKREQASVDLPRALPYVDWFSAVLLCQRLSALEGLDPAYHMTPQEPGKGEVGDGVTLIADATGYRLPTEAEWEYAARAGGRGVYANDRSRRNAWGLYDMSGNLWEWVWDHPGPYLRSATDPTGPEHGLFHVLRGGSWRSPARQQRSAMRGWSPLFVTDETVGFRLARSLPVEGA